MKLRWAARLLIAVMGTAAAGVIALSADPAYAACGGTTLPVVTASPGPTAGSISLSWTAVTGATSYGYRADTTAAGITTATTISNFGTTATTATITTTSAGAALTAGTSYTIAISGMSTITSTNCTTAFGTAPVSATVNATASTQLTAPTAVTVTGGATAASLNVAWTASSNAVAGQKYSVKVYSNSGLTTQVGTTLTGQTSPVSITTGLTAGTAYWVTVTAEASTGFVASAASTAGTGTATTQLNAPTAVAATPTTTSGSMSVSWTASSNAAVGQLYTVKVYSDAGLATQVGSSATGKTSPFTVTGLTVGTAYWYTVSADASTGYLASAASTAGTATTQILLATPSGVTAVGGASLGTVTISWTGSSNAPGGQLYTIKAYTDALLTTQFGTSKTGQSSPYTFTGLTAGTTYYFTITAEASGNYVASVASTSASTKATQTLNAPTAVTANGGGSATSQGSLSVTWTASSNAAVGQTYTVHVYSDAGLTTLVSATSGLTSPASITGLVAGTTYYATVTADASSGYLASAASTSASGTATVQLQAPTAVTVVGGAATGYISISWTAASNAVFGQTYTVKVYSNAGLTTQVGSTLTGQSSPVVVTGLTAGTQYWVTVTTEGSTGYTVSTASTAGTGKATVQLTAPTAVSAVSGNSTGTTGSVTVTWTASSNAAVGQLYTLSAYSDAGLTNLAFSTSGLTSPATMTGLTPGSTYYFTVTAEGTAGYLVSAASTSASAMATIQLQAPVATVVGGASATAQGSLIVSWSASSNAAPGQSYTVTVYSNAGRTTVVGTAVTNATSPLTITGLTAGTTYYIGIVAVASAGYVASANSASVNAVATIQLTAPTAVTVTPSTTTAGSFSVAWTASSNAIAGQLYTVRIYSDAGLTTLVGTALTGRTSPYTATGLTAGTTYYVTVSADASTGYAASSASTAGSGMATVQLSAPTGATISGGPASGQITASWTAPANAAPGQLYTVMVYSNSTLTTQVGAARTGLTSGAAITGLTIGTTYWITVIAQASTGYLVSAASASGTGAATVQLVAPTNINVAPGATLNSLTVSWTASSNAAGAQTYTIRVYANAGLTTLVNTFTGQSSGATVSTSLSGGVQYWVTVSADASTNYIASAASAGVGPTVATQTLAAPTGVTVVGGGSTNAQGSIVVSWTASTNAAPGQVYTVTVYSNAGRTTVVSTNTGASSPLTITGLVAGTTYYIGITATASAGYLVSAASTSANGIATVTVQAPTNVSVAAGPSVGSAIISWSASSNPSGSQTYTVRIYSDAGLTTLVGSAIAGRTSPYTATGLTLGQTYWVTVSADASTGYVASTASTAGTGVSQVQLAAPTGVTVTAGATAGSIYITWTASTNAVAGQTYAVTIYSDAARTIVVGSTLTGQTSGVTVSALTEGTTYYVGVVAEASTDYLASTVSTSANGKATVQLSAPTGVTVVGGASATSAGSISISWSSPGNAAVGQLYTVYVYSDAAMTNLALVAQTGKTSPFTATGLVAGNTYYVQVLAQASTGYLVSVPSVEGSGVATIQLQAPATVTVTGGSNIGEISVTWAASSNAAVGQTYSVYVYSNAGLSSLVTTLSGQTSPVVISGLTEGVSYWVTIVAEASGSYLASVATTSATTKATQQLTAPTAVTVTGGASTTAQGSISVSWTASSNAIAGQLYTVLIYSDASLTTLVTTLTGKTSPTSVTGLVAGTTYYAVVVAEATTGNLLSPDSAAGSGLATIQLATPTGVAVTGGASTTNQGSISVSWTASTNAAPGQTYTIVVYSNSTRTTVFSTWAGKTSPFVVTGLASGTTYYIGITADASTGYVVSARSASANGVANIQLQAPTAVTVVGGAALSTISVSWTASSNAAAGQLYSIYVYSNAGLTTQVGTTTTGATSPATISGLTAGTTYYVVVVAQATTGYLVSSASTSGSGAATQTLTTPTGVTVTGGGSTTSSASIIVSWTGSTNAAPGQTYTVVVYSNSTRTTIVSTNAGLTSPATISGLTAGTTYYIGITATASTGYLVSGMTASASGTATIALQAPTAVTFVPSSTSGSVGISWTASSNAAVSQRYTIRIYSDAGLTTLVGTAITGQTSPYTATGLTVGTQYWVTVSADASTGYVASAASVSATTTVKILLNAPTAVLVGPGTLPGSLTISWTSSSNAVAGQTYTVTLYSDAARTVMVGSPITGQTSPVTVSPLQLVAMGEGVTYYVVVSADATGNYLASANSTAASGKTTVQLVAPTAVVFGPGTSTGTAVISWTASVNASATAQTYTVRIYSDAAQTILVGIAHAGVTSPYTATGLTVGTQYWATVSADAQIGYLASSASDFGTDFVTVQLSAPSSVTVTGGNAAASTGSIVVSFTAPTNAAPGQVYTVTIYYTSARNTVAATIQTTSTSVTFTGLNIGVTYYVGIVAEGSANYVASAISALASGAATVQLLAPTTATVAAGLTAGSISITWTASSNAAANQTYSIYVYNSAALTTLVASSLAHNLSAYNVTGLTQGATYYVVIIADGSPSYVVSAASSAFSGAATVQLSAPNTVVAAGGAAVAASGSLVVTFTAPTNAAAGQTYTFKVYSNVGLTTLVATYTGKVSGSVVTGLAVGVTYWVTVTSEASTGYLVSAASASSTAVANTKLAAPTSVSVNPDSSAASIRITWVASSNAAAGQTYSIKVYSDAGLTAQVGSTVTGAISGQAISGLTEGVTYYVVVIAESSGSYLASANSAAASGNATIQLLAPTNVNAAPGTLAGSIAVTFTGSSNAAPGQTYLVSIYTDSAHTNLVAQQSGIAGASAQLSGLTQGDGYFVVVVAEASTGYLASAQSAHSANFATVQLLAPTFVTVLGGNSADAQGSIFVEWLGSANAAFGQTYTLAIYSDAARTQLVGTLRAGVSSPITITGLTAGHTYYAVVVAEASTGFLASANSSVASGMANIKIQAPTGVSVVPGSASGSIVVSFTGSTNAMAGQKYTVVVWGDAGLTDFIISADLVSGSPVTITGLAQTTTVYITVFAESSTTGFDASDDSASANGRVKTTITVTATTKHLLYGDAAPTSYNYTAAGFFAGDTFLSDPSCSLAAGVSYVAGSDAGNYRITCAGATVGSEYNVTYVSANVVVAKRHITFTADNANVVYGDAVPDFSVSDGGDGIYGFDSFAALLTCDTDYAQGSNVGNYYISCSGPSSTTNYVIDSYTDGTLSVAKRQLNILANDHGIAFGDAVPTLNITVDLNGLYAGDSLVTEPTCSTTYVQGDALGTYPIVCSGAVATSNYEILSYIDGTITVDVRVVTITVGSISIHYGEAAPTGSFSFVTTDAVVGDPLWLVEPVCSTDYVLGDNAGTYTISCVGTQVDGINIRYVTGKLIVAKRTVTFTPDALTVHYGDAISGYNYSLSGMTIYGSDDLSTLFTCGSGYSQGSSAGTYTISCTGAASNANYLISYATASLTVLKRAITVTADDLSVTHGEASPSYSSTLSGDSLYGSDNLNGVYSCGVSGYSIHTHVGTHELLCTGLSSTTNYVLTYVAGTLTVTQKDLTIAADANSVTYGNAAPSFTSIVSGLIVGESLATGAACTVAEYTVTTHVGTYEILCSGAVQSDYNITYLPAHLTVTKRALVITADAKSVVYAHAPPAFTSQNSGFVNGDSLTTGATCVANDFSLTTHVGTVAITCSGAAQSDYEISYMGANLTITKRALTIAADAKSVVYGTGSVDYSFTATGLVNGDSLSIDPNCAFASYSGLTHVGTYTITCAGAAQGDYEIAYEAGALTVTKHALTVTADDHTVTYGNSIASYGFVAVGFINGDAFGTTPICGSSYDSTTAVASSPVVVICHSGAQSDYEITYVIGAVAIEKRVVVATANHSAIYGDAVPTYVLSAANFVNGETWVSEPLCTSVYNDHTSVGSYAVTCSGGSVNGNYSISYVNGSISVAAKSLTLTADSHQIIYGDTAPTYGFSTVGLVNGDLISIDPACISAYARTSHVGHYSVVCESASAGANYVISYVNGTISVSPRELVVTGSSHNVTYGSTDPAYFETPTGLVNGDALLVAAVCTSTYTPLSHVGTYGVTCEFTPTTDYVATFVEGVVTVSKRALVVTANDHHVAYSTAISEYGITATGFVNGDTFAVAAVCVSTYSATSSVGTYGISCDGAEQSDYDISYVGGHVFVAKKLIVVSAVPINLVYGDAIPNYDFTDNGFGNGETYLDQPVCETSYTHRTAVGTLTIVCTGAVVSDNYEVTYQTAVLTIAKRDVYVTANSKNLLYGTIPTAYTQVTTGLVNGDVFATPATCSSTYTRYSAVGSYDVVCVGATQSNYAIHFVNGAVNVSKRNLTITALAVNLIYGDDVPLFDYSMSGLINGDIFVAGPTCDASYTPTTGVGAYPIVCDGAAQPNYNIIYVSASLNVAPFVIHVTPADQTVTYGDNTEITYEYTIEPLINGDSMITMPLCTSAYTPSSGAGTVAIECLNTDAGANYRIVVAPAVVTVQKRALNVYATDASVVYGSATAMLGFTEVGFVNGDVFTSNPTCTAHYQPTTGVGGYAVTCAGGVQANYAITYHGANLVVTARPLTIFAVGQTVVYGTPIDLLTGQVSGLVNGDHLTVEALCVTNYTVTTPAGSTAPITCSDAVQANYDISYVPALITVTVRELSVTAGSYVLQYGDAVPDYTMLTSGFAQGEGFIGINPTCYSSYSVTSTPGTYTTSCFGGLVSSNYNVTYHAGSIVVSKRSITVIADDKTVTYANAGPSYTYTLGTTNFVNGQGFATLPSCSFNYTTLTAAGTYDIVCRNASLGANAANYDLTYQVGHLTVAKRALTVTATDTPSTSYGDAAPNYTYSASGFVNGDTFVSIPQCSYSGYTVRTTVGTYSITCANAVQNNYQITYVAGTLTVVPRALTVSANAKSVAYGDIAPAYTFTATGFVNGDGFTTTPLCNAVVGSGTYGITTPAGSYNIVCSGGVQSNYSISYVTGRITVNPKRVTITADYKFVNYGDPLPGYSFVASSLINGDAFTTNPMCVSTYTRTSAVGTYAISCSGAVQPNYLFFYVDGSVTVAAKPITVTATDATKEFGDALPTFTYTTTGFANSENFTVAPICATSANSLTGVGSFVINCSGAILANYQISYVAGTLSITRKSVLITAKTKNLEYGDAVPTYDFNATGLNNQNVTPAFTTQPTCSASYQQWDTPLGSTTPRTYAISCSGAVGSNYNITYASGAALGQVVLSAKSVNVTPTAINITYGQTAPSVSFTEGSLLGSDVFFSHATCSVTYNQYGAAGTYPIVCSGGDAGPKYNFVYVPANLTVAKRALTVNAVAANVVYGSTLGSLTPNAVGFINGDGFTVAPTCSTSYVAGTTHVGTLNINCSGAVQANYDITYNAATLTVTQKPLTVTADAKTVVYGGANPGPYGYTTAGFVGSDRFTTAPTCAVTYATTTPAGSYPIVCSGAVASDYLISYAPVSLVVTQAPLTVTADDLIVNHGDPIPNYTATATGFINGDGFTTAPICSSSYTPSASVGTLVISCRSAVSPNYTITYVPGTMRVGRPALVITANAATYVYGAAKSTLTYTITGLITGDHLTTSPSCTSGYNQGSSAGTYAITCYGAVIPNYDITYVDGTLTVTKRSLTITPVAQYLVYGDVPAAPAMNANGFFAGDSFTVAPTCSASYSQFGTPGTYPITCSGAVADNYNITYASGSIVVSKLGLTVQAESRNLTYGDAYPTGFTYTATGFIGNETFTTAPTCSTTFGVRSPAGNYSVICTGGVQANYAITYVAGTLRVAKKSLMISADAKNVVYGDAGPGFTFTASPGLIAGDSFTTAPRCAPTSAGTSFTYTTRTHAATYSIVCTGAVQASYDISYSPANFVVAKHALQIAAKNLSVTYGTPGVPAFDYIIGTGVNGLVNGDVLTTLPNCAATYGSRTPAGNYDITCTPQTETDYDITYVTGTLTVTPRNLSVTVADKTMVYGSALPAFVPNIVGLLTGDLLTTQPTCAPAAASTYNVGSYSVTCSGAVQANYNINYGTANLTVTPKALAVTTVRKTIAAGDNVPTSFTISTNGFLAGDDFATAPICTTNYLKGNAVGDYAVNCDGAVASNYTITYTPGVLTVSVNDPGLAVFTINGVSVLVNTSTNAPNGTTSVTVVATPKNLNNTVVVSGDTGLVVGPNTITISVYDSNNALLTTFNATVVVAPAAITPIVVNVPAGSGAFYVNGVLQTNITPTPVTAINQIRVSGAGWLTTVSATTKTGSVLPLVGGGLAVTAGAKFNFMSTGYLPNTSVNVYVMSTPQLLGTFTTDANGNLFVSVTLPTTLANGGHTIQLNGVDKSGYVRSASLGFGLTGATSGGGSGGNGGNGGSGGTTAKTTTVKAFFTFGSVAISAAAKTVLKGLATKVGAATTINIVATGMTRNVGTTAVDLATAAKRAKAVVAYLKSLGVTATFTATSATGPGQGDSIRRVDVKATYK